ncbi:hypothetical protein O6P43_006324 [Quillaja saponaria]|uniref:Uncharacterized protein n=1 Tax=Quillaja saponaria TaxID=32244 RepID=A0AAD7VI77_QUISA|nr:hypothetical protein O6P43_006324 [Quillaja saponaria]
MECLLDQLHCKLRFETEERNGRSKFPCMLCITLYSVLTVWYLSVMTLWLGKCLLYNALILIFRVGFLVIMIGVFS